MSMKRLVANVLCLSAGLIALPAQAGLSLDNLGSVMNLVQGVSKSQAVANMSEPDEIAVGQDLASRTLTSYPLVKDAKLQRYLNRVGLWVALQSPRPSLPWQFAVVQSPQINAFAVPGGTILITSGMLGMVTNEAELACVLGHEIGHVTRKHHLALLQKEILMQTGTSALNSQVSMDETKKFIAGQGSQLFGRALDRDSEREADTDGVLLAARAGYDPEACHTFMQRMADMKQDAGALASLYKTHPRPADRVGDVVGAVARLEGMEPGSGVKPALEYKSKAH